MADQGDDADRSHDSGKRKQQRNTRGDQGAEGDQQDDERYRQRRDERALKVFADDVRELLFDTRFAKLLDGEISDERPARRSWPSGRVDPIFRLAFLPCDLEPQQS